MIYRIQNLVNLVNHVKAFVPVFFLSLSSSFII